MTCPFRPCSFNDPNYTMQKLKIMKLPIIFAVFWVLMPLPSSLTLKMEAPRSSETLVSNLTTLHGATTHKTTTSIFIAVKTSNFLIK